MIFCISTAIVVASGVAFALYADFLALTPSGVFRCKDLMSSGSDDALAMAFFAVLLPSIVIRIVRWNKDVAQVETVIFIKCLAGAGAAVFMSLDCGDFFFTALVGPNPYLVSLQFFSLVAIGAMFIGTGARAQTMRNQD